MITSLADIKRHLQPGFTELQTNLLATCLYECYEPIVHQREMAAIRDTLDRAAAIQARTDERLERIAAGQDASNQRIDRLVAAQEEMRADIENLVDVTREVVWGIGDLRKQVGGIALSVGQGLEAYAMERIPALLEERYGFKTQSAMPEVIGPPGASSEIDVVYRGSHEGQPVVVLSEVKTNITETEVRDFLAVTDRVRGAAGSPDVRVLFFCYRAADSARRLIAEYGCLLAFPRGLVVD
ncbi:MAG: hypothetical protein K8S94_04580 [Planctomycetia bacterium]|nr:hypothetical protein [Planctomycetia bacterium]